MNLNEKIAVIITMSDAAIFAHAIKENSFNLFDPKTGDVLKDPFIERFVPVTDVVLSLVGLARINSDMATIGRLNAIQDLIEMYKDDPRNLDFVFDLAPVFEVPEVIQDQTEKPLSKFERVKALKEKKAAEDLHALNAAALLNDITPVLENEINNFEIPEGANKSNKAPAKKNK